MMTKVKSIKDFLQLRKSTIEVNENNTKNETLHKIMT